MKGSLAVSLAALVVGVAMAPAATAQRLVKDIRPGPPSTQPGLSSSPDEFVVVAGIAYFAARTREFGTELWRTDGTAEGTVLVKDIITGPEGSDVRELTDVAGRLFFVANTPQTGFALWSSDGTSGGTALVGDGWLPQTSPGPGSLTAIGNRVFFAMQDPVVGNELWVADTGGVQLVADIVPGSGGSGPRNLTEWNGALWFSADNGRDGLELWRSDGTSLGTALFADLRPGNTGSDPRGWMASGRYLYFSTNDLQGEAIWVTDGTTSGTRMLANVAPSGEKADVDGTLFFTDAGRLWKTDGSVVGTGPISGDYAGAEGLAAMGGVLYFNASHPSLGEELWRTDGSEFGTYVLRDLNQSGSSAPEELSVCNGKLYFSAYDRLGGLEPWISDGSALGTRLLFDVQSGTGFSYPGGFVAFGRGALFVATNNNNGREPWISDGTSAGTRLLRDIEDGASQVSNSSTPSELVDVRGTLFFVADDGTRGRELWRSDGSDSGTRLVFDIRGGSQGSNPANLTAFDARVFFSADDGGVGIELWASDGSSTGTAVFDIHPWGSSAPDNFAVVDDLLYFAADDGSNGRELWRTDGSRFGTSIVADIATGFPSSNPCCVVPLGPRACFVASAALWITEGTPASTRRLPVGAPESPVATTADLVFLTGHDGGTGRELWCTDGTPAGTRMVKDIVPGSGDSAVRDLLAVGSRVYFVATLPTFGDELWTSDGTEAGTVLVADIAPGAASPDIRSLVAADPFVMFTASDATHGRELWRSDGTAAGTQRVADVNAGVFDGPIGGELRQIGAGATILFPATDGALGVETWRSDGTAAGTARLGDIAPGARHSAPLSFTTSGSTVYFTADDGIRGRELWALPFDATGGALVEHYGQGCAGTGGVVPRLLATGAPTLGNATFALAPERGLASAMAFVMLSLARDATRLGACDLLVQLPAADALATTLDAAGRGSVSLPIPAAPALRGAHLYLQLVVVDPAGGLLGLASLSGGVHLVLGV